MRARAGLLLGVWIVTLAASTSRGNEGAVPRRDDPTIARLRDALLSGTDASGPVARASRHLVSLGADAMPLLGELAGNGRWEVRRRALFLCGEIGGDEARAILRDAVDDPAWVVRREALVALGRLADLPARTSVTTALDDPVWAVRLAAARALRTLPGPGSEAALLQAARLDPDPDVREAAQVTLESFASANAIPSLVERYFASDEVEERLALLARAWGLDEAGVLPFFRRAARETGRPERVLATVKLCQAGDDADLDDPRLQRDLVDALTDPDMLPSIRRASSLALAFAGARALPALEEALVNPLRIPDDAAADRLVERFTLASGTEAIERLEAMLFDARFARARLAALKILSDLASPTSLEPLVRFAEGGPPSPERRLALQALAGFPLDRTRGAFRSALSDPDPAVRVLAIRGLAASADPEDVALAIRAAAAEAEAQARGRAVDALAESPTPPVLEALFDLARDDPNLEVRRRAILALGRGDAPGAFEDRLVTLAASLLASPGSPAVTAAAVQALGSAKTPRAADTLLEIARDPGRDPSLRRAALRNYARIRPGNESPDVFLRLAEPTEPAEVRAAALLALEGSDPDRVCPRLLDLLDRDREGRARLLRALGTLGCRGAAEPLLRDLREGRADPGILVEVIETLAELGADLVEAPLVETARRADLPAVVRAAAVRALGGIGGRSSLAPLRALLREAGRDDSGGAGSSRDDPDEIRRLLLPEIVNALCRLGDSEGVAAAIDAAIHELVREAERPELPPVWNRALVHALRTLPPPEGRAYVVASLEKARRDGTVFVLGQERFREIAEAARFAALEEVAEVFYRLTADTPPIFTRKAFLSCAERAKLLERGGSLAEAADAFRRAARIGRSEGFTVEEPSPADGSDPAARLAASSELLDGLTCLAEGNRPAAREHLERALSQGSSDGRFLQDMASALLWAGEGLDLASEAIERAARLNPDSPETVVLRAEVDLARGKTDRALEAYRRLLTHPGLADSFAASVLLRAAEIEREEGAGRERAADLVHRALRRDPTRLGEVRGNPRLSDLADPPPEDPARSRNSSIR